MALQASDIQTLFKLIGKLAHVATIGAAHAEAYKRVTMAAVDQGVSGNPSLAAAEYDLYDGVLNPLKTKTKAAITAVSKLPADVATLTETFLTTHVRTVIGASATDKVGVLDSLRAKMEEFGLYLQANLLAFFANTLNYNNLPSTGTTAIPDAWITDAVV
jgi:hypothetical protein